MLRTVACRNDSYYSCIASHIVKNTSFTIDLIFDLNITVILVRLFVIKSYYAVGPHEDFFGGPWLIFRGDAV